MRTIEGSAIDKCQCISEWEFHGLKKCFFHRAVYFHSVFSPWQERVGQGSSVTDCSMEEGMGMKRGFQEQRCFKVWLVRWEKESDIEMICISKISHQLLVALQNPTDLHLSFINPESSNFCDPPTSSPSVILSLILPALLESIPVASDRFLCASLVCLYSSLPWYLHSSVDAAGFVLCLSSS